MHTYGRAKWLVILLVACLCSLWASEALAVGSGGGTQGGERWIVTFNPGSTDATAREAAVGRAGAAKVKDLPLIEAVAVVAGPASRALLRQAPDVLRVSPDLTVTIQMKSAKPQKPPKPPAPPPPPQQLPWGVDRIDAEKAWVQSTGLGVKVAVLDTGIDLKHPDLKVWGGYNCLNPRKGYGDDNGHGTHVAGTIAALDNTQGVVGVAPGARLYAVKVLNAAGSGRFSDIIDGLTWCIQNGIQVVNMSFGAASGTADLEAAIQAAEASSIVLMAASGNEGGAVLFPAAYTEVIGVGATDAADAVPSWSNKGPEVELSAPGVDVLSTYKGGGYAIASGTSMATPHAAGSAALVLEDNPAYGPDEVRAVLTSTADDLGAPGWDEAYGHGLVDAEEAATGVETGL